MKKDLILPVVLGLGLYSQVNNVSVCGNNGIMLLLLYIILENNADIDKIFRKCPCAHGHGHGHHGKDGFWGGSGCC